MTLADQTTTIRAPFFEALWRIFYLTIKGIVLKNVFLLAVAVMISGLGFAQTPAIELNYGEPGPRAGTGFGDLRPVERSKADAPVQAALQHIAELVRSGMHEDYTGNSKTRLIIDVAADHSSGPVVNDNGKLRTEFRVRLKVQRHRAVFEHQIYQVSAPGDAFREELAKAVQGFMAQPEVARHFGYDSSQALALN